MCAMMAKGQKDEEAAEAGTVGGGLSVEAVTAHTGLGKWNVLLLNVHFSYAVMKQI